MVTVLAEAGVNHNGSRDLAHRLIDAAAEAGADAVKFQTFRATSLTSASAPKARYQEKATGTSETQQEMLARLELSPDDHRALMEHCERVGVAFLSTPFDRDSLDLLVNDLDVATLKVGSGDMNNQPLLHAIALTGKPVILSTGMATLEEVEEALGVAAHGFLGEVDPGPENFAAAFRSSEGQAVLAEKLTLLHCTTAYPTPPDAINLRAMDTMRETFGLPVGFSDHSDGIAIPIAAVGRGATMIEKHITLDRTMDGPDHAASLEPDTFREMVDGIRGASRALGSPVKAPTEIERANMAVARKSVTAASAIKRGEMFTDKNLTLKRPGDGLSPAHFWWLIGKTATQDYAPDDKIVDAVS
ncbi:MAG: N-acetylneuraminate synthase [Pseudomonadota bacterium]